MPYIDETTYYLAIDPGANGGWVYKGGATIICGKNAELAQLTINARTNIVVEKVPPYVGKFIPSSASSNTPTVNMLVLYKTLTATLLASMHLIN
jgi:hypothetical protein